MAHIVLIMVAMLSPWQTLTMVMCHDKTGQGEPCLISMDAGKDILFVLCDYIDETKRFFFF